jgi:hypothetical protein
VERESRVGCAEADNEVALESVNCLLSGTDAVDSGRGELLFGVNFVHEFLRDSEHSLSRKLRHGWWPCGTGMPWISWWVATM